MLKFPVRNDNTHKTASKAIHVIKRDGQQEPVSLDKITERLANLSDGLAVDPLQVSIKTVAALYNGITTERLDALSAKTADSLKLDHPDYSLLASRIVISNLHKSTPDKFSMCMSVYSGAAHFSAVASKFIADNADALDAMIIPLNDYLFDYFGFKILENTYMLKVAKPIIDKDGKYFELGKNRISNDRIQYMPDTNGNIRPVVIIEGHEFNVQPKTLEHLMDRPQYMFMRVAIAIYMNSGQVGDTASDPLPLIKECYEHLSNMYYIHATPTLFNSCGAIQQMLSCFLLGTADSIEDIMDNAKRTSLISKSAGGIGIHMNNIRPRGEKIGKSGGKASGLPQQIKIYNELARCWNQGGRRMGSFAIYIEPHHGDIMQFLQMKLQQGAETERARDLFYAVWCRDLFITRARNDLGWSLFSDRTAPGLSDVYDGMLVCKKCNYCHLADYAKYFGGPIENEAAPCVTHDFAGFDAYTQLYERYERAGLAIRTLPARKIIEAIVTAQGDNGIPYILHGDTANRQSQQNGLGTIKSSNLCVTPETVILTDKGQIAIGTLKNQTVNVWNGMDFTETIVRQTGINQQVITVNLSRGVSVNCTPYHKFYVMRDNKITCVNASSLVVDDHLIKYDLPHKCHSPMEIPTTKMSDKNMAVQKHLFLQEYGYDTDIIFEDNKYSLKLTIDAPTVLSVVDEGRTSDTFCFTEKIRGMGMFNGVLLGNCSEIIQWSSADSYACCTLASINLKRYLEYQPNSNGVYQFNFEKLFNIVRMIARNLDIIIDENSYPVEECVRNAKDYRPIGIGIQALADVFAIMRIPFVSAEAEALDMKIMETIYFAALTESMERAKTHGKWIGFENSPAARGQLRFDLWNYNQEYISRTTGEKLELPEQHYDWNGLRVNIMKYGLRNSLSVALMPTASTSQIMGNVESFEPFSFNIYTRSTLAGNFVVSNNYMIKHFIELGIWTPELRDYLEKDGSVKKLKSIPKKIRAIYKTAREIKQSELMRRCAMRQAYVCQSQSMNLHLSQNNPDVMEGIIYYGWDLGLTTGSYYTHTKAAVDALPTVAVKNITINRQTTSEPGIPIVSHTIGDDSGYSPPIQSHLIDKESSPVGLQVQEQDSVPVPEHQVVEAGEVCHMEAGCLMCGS